MDRFKLVTAAVLPLIGVASAPAAVIVGYNLSGLSGINKSAAPTTVDPGVTVSANLNLTDGPGVTATSGTHRLATHFADTTTNPSLTTFAAAYTVGNYFQFGVTVQPGAVLSLSAIDEDLRRSSGAAPGNFLYVYSFDGFSSAAEQTAPLYTINSSSPTNDLVTPTFTDAAAANLSNPDGEVEPTTNLSGLANLQNLPAGTTVTFRLLAYTSTTTSNSLGVGQLANDGVVTNDLALSGTVTAATPEPASIALIGFAAAGLLARRRR